MANLPQKEIRKQELHDRILAEARNLFLTHGVEATTMRAIAKATGCSVGTIYVYFQDKNAILHALHSQGFKMLGDKLRAVWMVKDPMDRLEAMGQTYIRYALENADMYNLMLTLPAPLEFLESNKADEWNEGKVTFNTLTQTIQDCLDAGYFKGHKLYPLTYLIWSTVHGMCSLAISGRSKSLDGQLPEDTVVAAYNELLQLIRK